MASTTEGIAVAKRRDGGVESARPPVIVRPLESLKRAAALRNGGKKTALPATRGKARELV